MRFRRVSNVSKVFVVALVAMLVFPPNVFAQGWLAKPKRSAPSVPTDPSMAAPAAELPLSPKPTDEMNLSRRMTLQTYNIHVYGAVVRPGIQVVNPPTRLTEALEMAEGIKSTGSSRRVILRRGGQKEKNFDLLMLERTGDLSQNPFLQDNDVIFVPFKDDVVSIQGPVIAPGDYELLKNHSLKYVLEDLCGGFTPGVAQGYPISVIRYNDKNEKKVLNISFGEDFSLENGDVVQVPHKFNVHTKFDYSIASFPNDEIAYPSFLSKVFVVGGVRSSQVLEYNPRFKVANYIAMAGGLSRLGRNDVTVRRLTGEVIHTDIEGDVSLSPGDTLIVGENKIGPEFWITFMVSLASLGLSSYAILRN